MANEDEDAVRPFIQSGRRPILRRELSIYNRLLISIDSIPSADLFQMLTFFPAPINIFNSKDTVGTVRCHPDASRA